MGHYSDITVIISNALLAPRHIVKERRQTEWQTERQTEREEGGRPRSKKAGKQRSIKVERERADREMNEPTHLGELLPKLIKFNLQWCSLIFLLA